MVARLWACNQLYTTSATDHEPESEVDEALVAFGLEREAHGEDSQDACYLWPCNERTWNIWLRLHSQWRTDSGIFLGLDYAAVIPYLERVERVKGAEFETMFRALQAMERAALQAWGEMRERRA